MRSILTDELWQLYYLWHPDHQNMSEEDVAKEMNLSVEEVIQLLHQLAQLMPDVFKSIKSGKEKDVLQYVNWYDEHVKMKF